MSHSPVSCENCPKCGRHCWLCDPECQPIRTYVIAGTESDDDDGSASDDDPDATWPTSEAILAESDSHDEQMDDIVDRWHKGEYGDKPLHECLTMTLEEYAKWVERPGSASDADDLPPVDPPGGSD